MKTHRANLPRERGNYTEMRASGKCLSTLRTTLSSPKDESFMQSMQDRTWELLQKRLESGCYYIVSSQDSAPTESDLRAVARDLGCELPEEFIVHSTNKYGGVYVEVKEELWPRPKELDVGPFWSFLYGLYTLNIADGVPDFMNLQKNAREFQNDTEHKVIPFLKIVGDADAYCFDQRGAIVHWDHELNELEKQDKSFFEVLDFELGELAIRKDRKLQQ
jgi:hypothetical protein